MPGPSSPSRRNPVTIIGAGIVGLSCAMSLQRRGLAVTMIDPLPPGRGASRSHSGGIAVTWVSPQGLPGILRRVPRWVLDPLGPVAVRWPYLPRLLPWLLRMQRQSTPERVERIGDALTALMSGAWEAWERLLDETGLQRLVRHDGALSVYQSAAGLEKDAYPWQMRTRRGFEVSILDADEVRAMEPALGPRYEAGVFEPEAKWCEDPLAIVDAMAEHFTARGGRTERATVSSLVTERDEVRAVRTEAGTLPVGDLVVAAGAWSHRLLGQIGHRVPLESERGYSVDLGTPGVRLRRILSLADHKMVVTPMGASLRLAGTAEFAGVDSPPDYRRARALLVHGETALPGLTTTGFAEWAGHRPILPDSLPVIARSTRHRNVYAAFGHSHIGFTLGPVTGELIADLVTGTRPRIDLEPFRLERFRRSR